MNKLGILATLALPVVFAACSREPEPAPIVMMSGPEQACADQAGAAAGVDASAVSVVPVSATKTGATVYTATAGDASYSCVVEADGSISSFTMQSMAQ